MPQIRLQRMEVRRSSSMSPPGQADQAEDGGEEKKSSRKRAPIVWPGSSK